MFEIYKKGQGNTARWIPPAAWARWPRSAATSLYDMLDDTTGRRRMSWRPSPAQLSHRRQRSIFVGCAVR